jgi:hypothetical protein
MPYIDGFGGWNADETQHGTPEDVLNEFKAPADALDGAELLLAWYGTGSYDGNAFVLYKKDGKLYEVNGGHCSCHGLEDQWEPEETSWEALALRPWTSYSSGELEAGQAMSELILKNLAPQGTANA